MSRSTLFSGFLHVPWFRIRSAIWVVFDPGAAPKSRTRSPGWGSSAEKPDRRLS